MCPTFSRNKNKLKAVKVDSLIGHHTELQGSVLFSGGFHSDGKLKGNVLAEEPLSLLTLSDHGVVEGDVRAPNIVLNGVVIGNVYASERIELAANAKVTGNVYYNLIEMAMGAEVNGNLVHQPAVDPLAEVTSNAVEMLPDGRGVANS